MTNHALRMIVTERRGPDPLAQPGYHRHHDDQTGITSVKIGPGDYYVTKAANEILVTILGSCIAVCMRDPMAGIGGMNHFLLPESATGEWGGHSAATRYGNHAMETLINDIIHLGGARSRLEVKMFGGAHVIDTNLPIGQANAEFAEQYLRNEGMTISAKHVGGAHPRRIHYDPKSGKVKMLILRRECDNAVFRQELDFKRTVVKRPVDGGVDLF